MEPSQICFFFLSANSLSYIEIIPLITFLKNVLDVTERCDSDWDVPKTNSYQYSVVWIWALIFTIYSQVRNNLDNDTVYISVHCHKRFQMKQDFTEL